MLNSRKAENLKNINDLFNETNSKFNNISNFHDQLIQLSNKALSETSIEQISVITSDAYSIKNQLEKVFEEMTKIFTKLKTLSYNLLYKMLLKKLEKVYKYFINNIKKRFIVLYFTL